LRELGGLLGAAGELLDGEFVFADLGLQVGDVFVGRDLLREGL
jgi:hypothetical protein